MGMRAIVDDQLISKVGLGLAAWLTDYFESAL
jgi:hypothetical protein